MPMEEEEEYICTYINMCINRNLDAPGNRSETPEKF